MVRSPCARAPDCSRCVSRRVGHRDELPGLLRRLQLLARVLLWRGVHFICWDGLRRGPVLHGRPIAAVTVRRRLLRQRDGPLLFRVLGRVQRRLLLPRWQQDGCRRRDGRRVYLCARPVLSRGQRERCRHAVPRRVRLQRGRDGPRRVLCPGGVPLRGGGRERGQRHAMSGRQLLPRRQRRARAVSDGRVWGHHGPHVRVVHRPVHRARGDVLPPWIDGRVGRRVPRRVLGERRRRGGGGVRGDGGRRVRRGRYWPRRLAVPRRVLLRRRLTAAHSLRRGVLRPLAGTVGVDVLGRVRVRAGRVLRRGKHF